MKRLSTFLLALLLTWIGANAQTITSGKDYVIVNKEANQFLYGSYNWGCEASIGSKPVTFTVTGSDNAYTLKANQWTGDHYVGADFYTDKSSSDAGSISITAVTEDEGYYYLSNASGAYLIGNGKNKYTTVATVADGADLSSDAAKWKFVTEEEILAGMENASSANPVDVSILISNPNFRPDGNNVTTVSNWTISNVTVGSYTSNYVQANAAEAYSKETFSISQSVSLPQKGYYTLSAQGFYRNGSDGNGTNTVSAQMYAGSATMDLPARRTTANTMAEAWDVFLQGKEPVEPIFINASNAGESVEIGFTGAVPNSSWAIFGELTLMYYGETLTYAIGEPECSASCVKPGSEVSITFPNCITPNYSTGEIPTLASSSTITVGNTTATATNLSYSGTTATVTFTMPSTIEYGATVTVSVPQGLLSWDSTDVSSAAAEFTLTTPPFGDQTGVYLYSVHADGFLSRGGEHTAEENTQSYGKIATTDPYGIPVDITFGDDGFATVKFLDSNLFLYAGGWAWTDGSETNAGKYLVEEVTLEGGETVYQFSYDGNADNYLYVNDEYWDWVANNGNFNGDDNLKDDITRTYWQIFTMAERDAYKEASILADHITVAAANGETLTTEDGFQEYLESLGTTTDITFMVADAALAGSLSGWTETDYYSDNQGTYFTTNANGTEIYQGDAKLVQTVEGLDEGIYKVTLQGFVRQGSGTYIMESGLNEYDLSIGFLEANGYQINLQPWATECENSSGTYIPDGMDNAFTNGRTYANELYTYVDEEGTLELSINCPDVLAGGWMMFKNLTLTYYGEDEYTNDVTWKLANPSFEVDNVVENLDVDTSADSGGSRHDANNKGAWKVESLTGWTLTGASSVNVCDLMTKDAAATDNNLGTPGEAADGTYMLYLKDTWTGEGVTVPASVEQKVTLPAGNYKLTVDSKFHSGGATAQLVAGDNSTSIKVNGTSGGSSSDDTIFSSEEWTTNTVTFTVAQDGDVTIGVEITFTNNSPGSILLDNFKLYSVDAIEETISWTMTDAGWGTLILPFAVASIPDGLTLYAGNQLTVGEEDGDGTSALTPGTAAESIAANTPYLVSGTNGDYTFKGTPTNEKEIYTNGLLTGTLVDLAVAKGAAFATDGTQYLLQHHEGVDDSAAFYPIIENDSKEATLDAYHCYLTLNSGTTSGGVRAHIDLPGSDDEATAIVAVESAEAEADGAIYDLSGRKVSKAVKGVYIQNGKKVLVK